MDLIDVVALRPRDPDQLQLLATRLNVALPKDWLRTMRWAGRAVLAARVRREVADRVLGACREAGVRTQVRPSHPENAFEAFISAHAKAIGRFLFAMAAVGLFVRLFLFPSYNMVIHFLGLLWLNLLGRNWTVFTWAGRVAGTLASLAIGFLALMTFHAVLAWTRLSPPLIGEGNWFEIEHVQPLPPEQSLDKRKIWPFAVGALIAAALGIAGVAAFRSYGISSVPLRTLDPLPEARRLLAPLPADPWKARAELEDRVRPRPDHRFLLAVSGVGRIIRGSGEEAAATWTGSAWDISLGGARVGSLPAMPSFADALALLRSYARQSIGGPGSLPAAPLSAGSDDQVLAALRAAQAAWSKNHLDRDSIHQAAEALSILSFNLLDELEIADALPARALAALAIDEELNGAPEPALETLLAAAMDYPRSAQEAARGLSAEEPLRQYVERNDAALRERASGGRGVETLLWQRRLDQLESAGAASWRATRLAAIADTLAVNRLRLTRTEDVRAQSIVRALALVKAAVERELLAERRASLWGRLRSLWLKPGHEGPMLEALESDLDEIRGPGPLFDRELVAAYYRAAAYTGLQHVRWQLQHGFGSNPEAAALVRSLGEPKQPLARQFMVFLRAPLPWESGGDYVQGKPGPEALAAGLPFGPRALEEAVFAEGGVDPVMRSRAVRILLGRLDTRLAHRQFLAHQAGNLLHDPVLARRACGWASLEEVEHDARSVTCASRLRDKEALLAIARSPVVSPGWRVWAVQKLGELPGVAPAEIDAEFDRLSPIDDGWASVVDAQEQALEDRGEYERARAVVERWLARYPGLSVNGIGVRTTHARLLQKEGRPQDAWQELAPLLGSEHGGTLMRATYVLLDLGKADEAEAMARRRLARYPMDWGSLETLLEVLWRSGKSEAATSLLAKPPFAPSLEAWHQNIGATFARAFKGATDEKAVEAFDKLRGARISPRELRELTLALVEAGRPGLEQATLMRLVEGGAIDPVTLARGAASIARLQGMDAAKSWLATRLKAEDVRSCARAMYESGEDELLWAALPDPMGTAADAVWLLRAAAAQRNAQVRDRHGEALRAHFASPEGGEDYRQGRYLAGAADEASLRPAASRTRTAWALGVRADAEGRRDDAIAWYGVALASSDWTEPERRFAERRLVALVDDHRSP